MDLFEQLQKLRARAAELEELLVRPETIADMALCNRYAKELAGLREPVNVLNEYERARKELDELRALLAQPHDKDFQALAESESRELTRRLEELTQRMTALTQGEDTDAGKNIILEIRPGTGGLEAGLFAADLYRMYCRYADKKGWLTETMSSNETEVGGIKEIVFAIRGQDAYRRLKYESGVHRVQRVPETEAQGRIHTSTATVAVLVEPEAGVDIEVDQNDLRIDTYRSSGPGGQHMQKTDSAVRITHLPTGMVVACQDERSQLKNKTKALRILKARLLDAKQQEETRKMSAERKSQIGSGDRSEKIRTYNFPDRRITDHRINFTTHRLEAVLEGELDEITDALVSAAAAAAAATAAVHPRDRR
jgi:peptide chain release factor 1